MGKRDKRFDEKWSKKIGKHGHTMIPNLLIWYSGHLGITAPEFMVLASLESYRWDTRYPFPSVETLAMNMGVTPRTITRTITSLVKKGYVKRGKHHAQLNEYDIEPLIVILDELANLGKRQQRSEERDTLSGGQERPVTADINVGNIRTKVSAEEDTPNQDSLNNTHIYSQYFINEDTDRIDLNDIDFSNIKDFDINLNSDETHKHDWREFEVERYKGEQPYPSYYFTCKGCGLQFHKDREKPWPAEYPLMGSDVEIVKI